MLVGSALFAFRTVFVTVSLSGRLSTYGTRACVRVCRQTEQETASMSRSGNIHRQVSRSGHTGRSRSLVIAPATARVTVSFAATNSLVEITHTWTQYESMCASSRFEQLHNFATQTRHIQQTVFPQTQVSFQNSDENCEI